MIQPKVGISDVLRKQGFKYINNLEMTNLNHSVDDGLEEKLKSGKFLASHSGMNFHGYVWWNGIDFSEEVFCFHEPQKVFRADSLKALMAAVNEEFGTE